VLKVRDNGIGFPAAGRDRVFGMFERFHPDHPGTGIGLALAHRAVQRLHGRIEMHPAPEGGTAFCIWLPRAG
jgi:signal transduction histidine kinase